MRGEETLSPVYTRVVQSLTGSISILTSQFKRIFKADLEERERRTSGRLNIKRLTTGTPSSRVFDRKRLPGNKRDTAVILLIDESGSMRGQKVQVAQQTAILLAEVFVNTHGGYSSNATYTVSGFFADKGISSWIVQNDQVFVWRNLIIKNPGSFVLPRVADLAYNAFDLRILS